MWHKHIIKYWKLLRFLVDMQNDINKALEVLKAGGVILYPTDTVWSLGCDAANETAVKRVCELAGADNLNEIFALVDNPGRLQSYVDEMPDIAWDLIEMAEKPLTIIYPGARNLAGNLIAKDKSVGLRVTNEAFSKKLCAQFRRPVVSAQVRGQSATYTYGQIAEDIKQAVDYVVNFRQDERSQPELTSIIKLGKGNVFQLIRE